MLKFATALIQSIEDEYGNLTETNPKTPPKLDMLKLDLFDNHPEIQRREFTLDDAIQHAQDKAHQCHHSDDDPCGDEHQQLAEWLLELQARRNRDITEPDQVAIQGHMDQGHTEHCAKRLVWGDAECECGKVPSAAPQRPRTITQWQRVIHQYALDKGWYDNDTRTFGDMCALFHSEISEAYDEYRNGHEVTETYLNPALPAKAEGVPTELADCVIRILDYCQRVGIDLQTIMERKHAYNLTRSYRHGGKRV